MDKNLVSLNENELYDINGGGPLTGWALFKTAAVVAGVGTGGVVVGVGVVVGTVWLLNKVGA